MTPAEQEPTERQFGLSLTVLGALAVIVVACLVAGIATLVSLGH